MKTMLTCVAIGVATVLVAVGATYGAVVREANTLWDGDLDG